MPTPPNSADTAVVIPCYNSSSTLADVVSGLRQNLPSARVVCIDDGSSDDTYKLARTQANRVIRHGENQGKGSALVTGLRAFARSKRHTALCLDADMQHLPSESGGIVSVNQMSKAPCITLGVRTIGRRSMPAMRKLSNFLTSLVISIVSDRRIVDSQCGFRAINRAALQYIGPRERGYMFESEMLLQAALSGVTINSAPVSAIYENSKSYVRPVADTLGFLKLLWKRLWF